MTTPAHPDPICPRCKNPMLDGDTIISRQGLTFHAGCGEGQLAWPVIMEAMHQRIAALEGILIRNTKKVLAAPFNAAESVPAPASGDDPTPAGLSRTEPQSTRDNGLWLAPVIDKAHLAPASGGDEAAVEAIGKLILADSHNLVPPYRTAENVLAAIRNRKVPGVYWSDDYLNDKQVAIYNAEIAALRAELGNAESRITEQTRRIATMGGDLASAQGETERLRANRDALAKRLAEAERVIENAKAGGCTIRSAHAEADRDRLAAQVEGLTRERDALRSRHSGCHGSVCSAANASTAPVVCPDGSCDLEDGTRTWEEIARANKATADRALADLAAQREVAGAAGAALRKLSSALGNPCVVSSISLEDGLVAEALRRLSAERAAREKAERELLTLKECIREYPCANGKQHEPAKDCLYCERDAAQAKLAKAVGVMREVAAFPRGKNAPGSDILDRLDALLVGVSKKEPVTIRRRCIICGGTGEECIEEDIFDCPACNGTGFEDEPAAEDSNDGAARPYDPEEGWTAYV